MNLLLHHKTIDWIRRSTIAVGLIGSFGMNYFGWSFEIVVLIMGIFTFLWVIVSGLDEII